MKKFVSSHFLSTGFLSTGFLSTGLVKILALAVMMLLSIATTSADNQILLTSQVVTLEQAEAMPLLDISALKYKGGFRLPDDPFGDDPRAIHSYSSEPIVFNSASNSLFTVSHDNHQAIGEFAIPDIVASDDPQNFETASVLQNFREFHQNGSTLTCIDAFFRITGMSLVNSKLVVTYI